MVLYTLWWIVIPCLPPAVLTVRSAASKAIWHRKLLSNLCIVYCERLLCRSGSLNWVASDCKLRATVGCEWPQHFLKWQSVNPYGDSKFDGGAAQKVSVSRLSHYSTSHHYETLVKRAYFHHAMAEYVIIQTEIKLKYNLLQLEKSLKKNLHTVP